MVTTRYSDQQGSKSRQKVMRLYKQWHRPISRRFIKPLCSISRATSIDSDTTDRHFGIEDESFTAFFKPSINGRLDKSLARRGGGDSWERTCICNYYGFRSSCSKRRYAVGFIMSSLREAFVSWLRVDVMEQASGSIMTGMRAFSAHLPLTLCWPSTDFPLFVY